MANGQVRAVYRHMAVLGEESLLAAQASECAAEQGHFWEYADRLYERQAGRNQGTFSKVNLKRYAGEVGLDRAAFNTCLDEERYASRVLAETQAGRARGVTRVPTVFVNGRPVVDSQDFSELRALIDAAR